MNEATKTDLTASKRCLCPLCTRPMQIDGFLVFDNAGGTWSTVDPIRCPYPDCEVVFEVKEQRAYFVPPPQATPPAPLHARKK